MIPEDPCHVKYAANVFLYKNVYQTSVVQNYFTRAFRKILWKGTMLFKTVKKGILSLEV